MAILSQFFNRMQQIICVLVRSHRQTHAMVFFSGGDYDKRRAPDVMWLFSNKIASEAEFLYLLVNIAINALN